MALPPSTFGPTGEPDDFIRYTPGGSLPARLGPDGEPPVTYKAGAGANELLDNLGLGEAVTVDQTLAPRAYWQIRVTAMQGGQFNTLGVRELAFLDATATEIDTAGGTPFGSPADTGFMPAQAFDHDQGTAYVSNGSIATLGELILGMQFATPVAVKGVALTSTSNNNNNPLSFELRASTDGVTWTVANSVANTPNWPSTETKYFFVAPGNTVAETLGTADVVDAEIVSIPPVEAEYFDDLLLGDSAVAVITGSASVEGESTDKINLIDTATFIFNPGAKVEEGLGLGAVVTQNWAKSIVEQLAVQEVAVGNMTAAIALIERLRLADNLGTSADAQIVETLGVTAIAAAVLGIQVIERLGLTDNLAAAAKQAVTLTERIRFQASLEKFLDGSVIENLGVHESGTAVLYAMQTLLEALGVQGTLAQQLLLSVIVSDNVGLDDTALLNALWSGTIVDGIELSIGHFGSNGEYTAWAMNTRTSAVTEYQNFAFNSFMRIGNKYLGCSDDGLFELAGVTDDGEAIVATLRGGYMQFGGTKLSRLKEAYVSVRAPDGKVLLKIISADGDEYVYQVDTRSMRNTKVHMGKGQRARYFAYELVTEGQDFDLDTIEFVPIVVQRRV